ncbi:MAG: 5-formyltetrahydrofolate cyclo-ligase [Alphaproteobacteria bacterium]|nr:5-formyltetrahydrofolate cyclo-ligase [Alphaproteobacteria bacterium]|tara:strand:- start:233 stop:811 length:579 start_codon:yes stop_codon:yes gene_type:complete
MDEITAKASLREVARKTRRQAALRAAANAPELAAIQFMESINIPRSCVVSGYWPIQDELDPLPLMARLQESGCTCALPVVTGRQKPLKFHSWSSGDTLVDGPFGTKEPESGAPEVIPEILVVPLLAFDARGYRLGYGGGFYDRTLRTLRRQTQRCRAIGFAFADQKVQEVPVGETDEPLDWIVSETYARAFS